MCKSSFDYAAVAAKITASCQFRQMHRVLIILTRSQWTPANANANANTIIASIDKSTSAEPQRCEDDEDNVWANIECECEDEEKYELQPGGSSDVLYPICIGDVVHSWGTLPNRPSAWQGKFLHCLVGA